MLKVDYMQKHSSLFLIATPFKIDPVISLILANLLDWISAKNKAFWPRKLQ